MNKKNVKFGNIASLETRRLGDLEMRVLDAADKLGLTFLHEALPPRGAAPYVTHLHTLEFVFVTKGKMSGDIGGKKFNLREGDYLLIPPGVEHRFRSAGTRAEAVSIFTPPMKMDKPDARIVFMKKRIRRAGKK